MAKDPAGKPGRQSSGRPAQESKVMTWGGADPAGPACHTLAASCFYRTLDGDSLRRNDT